MDALIKNKWIEALKSGEYKQGTGRLRKTDNRYCCLGVLCDVYAKTLNKEWRKANDFYFSFDGSYSSLSPTVEKWAGINVVKQSELIHLNDDERLTFDQIADHIEEKF